MEGTTQLGLEGKLDFTRERSRVGLAEGTACEKERGTKGQARETEQYTRIRMACMEWRRTQRLARAWRVKAPRAPAVGSVDQAWAWNVALPSLGDAT